MTTTPARLPLLRSVTTDVARAPFAVYTCDAGGRITSFSDAAAGLWGAVPGDEQFWCAAASLFGGDGQPIAPGDSPAAVALRDGAETAGHRLSVVRADGARVPVIASTQLLRDEGGAAAGVVTLLEPAARQPRSNAARGVDHAGLIEAMGVAVYATDTEGLLMFFNDAAAAFWGRRPRVGVDVCCGSLRLYWPDGRPVGRDDCPMAVTLREGRASGGVEVVTQRADGTRVPFVSSPVPLFDASGVLTGAVNVLIDVTTRKAAQDALHLHAQQLEAVFQSSVVGIAEMAPDASFRAVNDRFCAIVGRSREELLAGTTCMDVTHPDDREHASGCFESLRRGENNFTGENRYVRPDGSLVWTSKSGAAVRDASGELLGSVAIVTDISGLVQATQDLVEANARKDEFLSMVSHELRTPLTTILGNANILYDRAPLLSDEQRQAALGDVKTDAERLNRVIENLLTIARLDRGQEVEIEPLLLGRILRQLIETARAARLEYRYLLDVPDAPMLVEGNAFLIEQVVKNLLSNAEKYGSDEIHVSARLTDGAAVVAVEDRGSGISPAELDAVFTPFYRSERAAAHAGIGVGLSVCRRLIDAMHGNIWSEPREGGGARFAFSLPLSADASVLDA